MNRVLLCLVLLLTGLGGTVGPAGAEPRPLVTGGAQEVNDGPDARLLEAVARGPENGCFFAF